MYNGDMIVNLTQLPEEPALPEGVRVNAAYPGNRDEIMAFIRENFGEGWVSQAELALMNVPSRCFIAVKDNELVGFACAEATAKGFFGPLGVAEKARGQGLARALILRTLHFMREQGYIYAVIGWVNSAAGLYEKVCGARFIPGGEPPHSVYGRAIRPMWPED